eukprot:909050-Prorocentrum_minimum.AAC.1
MFYRYVRAIGRGEEYSIGIFYRYVRAIGRGEEYRPEGRPEGTSPVMTWWTEKGTGRSADDALLERKSTRKKENAQEIRCFTTEELDSPPALLQTRHVRAEPHTPHPQTHRRGARRGRFGLRGVWGGRTTWGEQQLLGRGCRRAHPLLIGPLAPSDDPLQGRSDGRERRRQHRQRRQVPHRGGGGGVGPVPPPPGEPPTGYSPRAPLGGGDVRPPGEAHRGERRGGGGGPGGQRRRQRHRRGAPPHLHRHVVRAPRVHQDRNLRGGGGPITPNTAPRRRPRGPRRADGRRRVQRRHGLHVPPRRRQTPPPLARAVGHISGGPPQTPAAPRGGRAAPTRGRRCSRSAAPAHPAAVSRATRCWRQG